MTRTSPIVSRPLKIAKPVLPIGTRVRILAPRDEDWQPMQDSGTFTGRVGVAIASDQVWVKVRFDDGTEWPFDLYRVSIVRSL